MKKFHRFVRFTWLTRIWYKITQFFTRDINSPVMKYDKLSDIPAALGWGNLWRPDPFNGKLDVQYHPTYVQKWISLGNPKHNDCEDTAGYWAAAIKKSNLASDVWLGFIYMKHNDTGKTSGHCVVLFKDLGRYFWADYREPMMYGLSPVQKWDWVPQVAAEFNATPLAAASLHVRDLTKYDGLKFGKREYKYY